MEVVGRGQVWPRLPWMSCSLERRSWLDSPNSLERLDGEIKCRANVVGIVPNEADVRWLVVKVLAAQTDERSLWRAKYMSLSARSKRGDDALLELSMVTI